MSYSIIGAGAVGGALARAFARNGIEVGIASRRPPEALATITSLSGPMIVPKTLAAASAAEIIFLAVPFQAHRGIAQAIDSWDGKIIVDATNAFGTDPEDLGNLPSSVVVSRSFVDAKVVKAFNHLPARLLAENPDVHGGRRVVFLSSDDKDASARLAALAEQIGFAPVDLGPLDQGGLLVQARGRVWAPLIFQDLVKF